MVTRARIEISAREHFDMVDALEARDVKRLQKIIAAHVGQDISERGRESRPHSLIRRAGPDRHAAIRQRIAAVVLSAGRLARLAAALQGYSRWRHDSMHP